MAKDLEQKMKEEEESMKKLEGTEPVYLTTFV